MHKHLRHGFTIVEILVVVVVITILVLITATIYQNAQVQARDTKMHDASAKFAEAIGLWSANNSGARPKGGYTPSTTDAPNGNDCTVAAEGFQSYDLKSYNASNYECTIGDSLVTSGYLTADFFNGLPDNANISASYGVPANKLRYFTLNTEYCTAVPNKWILLYTLESPSQADTSNFDAVIASCGRNADKPTWIDQGLRAARLITFSS